MKETDEECKMVDFREYLEIEDYLTKENNDIFSKEYEDDVSSFDYFESPFKPIEIGDYILYLFASEQNFCTPAINSFDKYFFKEWEVMIEKYHSQYGYVICSAEVMNEMGYDEFEPENHYIAYADNEMVQDIFEHLVNKLKLPEI